MMNTAIQLYDGQLSTISKPIPRLNNPNDVVVKVAYSGLCDTDLSIIAGRFPAARRIVQGHEFSGVVSEVGEDVTHLKPGDRVCINPFDYCSTCYFCVRGQSQFCVVDAMKTAVGYQRDGGWQQFCVVPGKLCHIVPPTMTLSQAVLVQPYSVVLRGWDNMGSIPHDANVLIGGAGFMGILWACLFHHYGYRDITIVEAGQHRQDIAHQLCLGVKVIHPKDLNEEYKESERLGEKTWGYDLVVDCAGSKKVIEAELKWLRKGGTLVLFGLSARGTQVSMDMYEIYSKEVKIVTSCLTRFTFSRAVSLVHSMAFRYLQWEQLAIRTYHLHDYEAAIEALAKGEITKAVFEM